AFELKKNQHLKIIDPQGQQVADLFAFNLADTSESLSSGRSIDYNNALHLTTGHILYSNRSNSMFTITEDTVGKHDFLFAPCSQAMFQIQYGATDHHPNCLENLTNPLKKYGVTESMITTPFNTFMNARIAPDGSITIHPPLSKPNDHITFRAETDLLVAVSACSAGACNNHNCTPINLEIT
ncbi:MAG: urea carboxylase-associated family protein, partial [Planctomycetes bacterium]|nr:urea carboxylase-associated family protein [Planctomycetota bacterium]